MKKLLLLSALFFVQSSFAISDFSLPWMNAATGTIYKSTDYPNAVFVVEAYYLDCYYCNENAPNVDALAEKYKDNPRVQVLDVGIDRYDSQYATWIKKHSPNHPVLKDSSRKLINQLGTSGYPSTYVIKGGKVIESTVGSWQDSDREALETAIDGALVETCSED